LSPLIPMKKMNSPQKSKVKPETHQNLDKINALKHGRSSGPGNYFDTDATVVGIFMSPTKRMRLGHVALPFPSTSPTSSSKMPLLFPRTRTVADCIANRSGKTTPVKRAGALDQAESSLPSEECSPSPNRFHKSRG
jgi:hypothetical protein